MVESAERSYSYDVSGVVDAVGRLETGGVIAVIVLVALGLIGFLTWLYNKREAVRAQLATAEFDRGAKQQRAELYSDALRGQADAVQALAREISGMREDLSNHTSEMTASVMRQGADIHKALIDAETSHVRREQKRDARVDDTFNKLHLILNELLERQKGTINYGDSIRIIEECFDRSIKPQAVTIAEQSLKTNHWVEQSSYIEERVVTELAAMVFHVERNLSHYQLRVDVAPFFPHDAEGQKALVTELWEIIKTLHVEGIGKPELLNQRLSTARIRINNTVNRILNEGRRRVGEDYEAMRDSSRGGTGQGAPAQ